MLRATQIEETDPVSIKLEKLEKLVGADAETIALIAGLVGLKTEPYYEPLNLSPSQIRSRTMHALVAILLHEARTQPL